MKLNHPLELLAPARDLDCGIAAIEHGADAVYIGAPKFGARAAAGNSLADIEQLVRHAHLFSARVYIALNTLFNDREIEEAARLVYELYDLGVDALIIQDMGLLEYDLPPIPLHASTQANNRTAEKVRFLEQVGFQQVVLARELSLAQIRKIRQETSVPLECFIHGALCVSYSGQCYISERISGRSGNRGECAQFCRHRFTLKDATGKVIEQDRYLLSLKDLDLSGHIEQLIDAGVSSFKIEGRLKDSIYVKNVTAWYRQLLDGILEQRPELSRLSSGKCEFSFTPDRFKTFNRGKTDYFLTEKRTRAGSIHTPKSLGEVVGAVQVTGRGKFTIDTDKELHNGDGLCYFNADRELVGLKANRVDKRVVHHRERHSPDIGTVIYRNHDVQFIKKVQQSGACRFLPLTAEVKETGSGLSVLLRDEDGVVSETAIALEVQQAKRPGTLASMIKKQMQKCGGTVFSIKEITVDADENHYVPASGINELRRMALEAHRVNRINAYQREEVEFSPNAAPWLTDQVDFKDNITNEKARKFYLRHGVKDFALSEPECSNGKDANLMRTRYCIRAQLGICPKDRRGKEYKEPFSLTDKSGTYTVDFDCKACEMVVRRS